MPFFACVCYDEEIECVIRVAMGNEYYPEVGSDTLITMG